MSDVRKPVRWLELDGRVLRFDPELGQFVATLIIERPVFQDQQTFADLARKMKELGGAIHDRPVERNHVPQLSPTTKE